MNTLNIYDRLRNKVRSGATKLDYEERDKAIDILIESFSERTTRLDDETLLQMLDEDGWGL